MSARRRRKVPISAEYIARLGEQRKDISGFFTNRGRLISPIETIGVDFPADLLGEVDLEAVALHVSREALIKMLVREALDCRHLPVCDKRD